MRDMISPEIRTLEDSELITEPGFYRIPMHRHHGQPCDGVSVTSSVLRKIEMETPADVWASHVLNPNRYERPETTALRLGRVMAAYIEHGPEGVEEFVRVTSRTPESLTVPQVIERIKAGYAFPERPPNRPSVDQVQKYLAGKATPAATRAVEYWLDLDNDPRDKVNEKEWELICDMGRALLQDPASCAALGGIPEITMAFYDEEHDLWCLSRPDQVGFDGLVSDYKRASSQGRPFNHREVDYKITQYGYDQQIAFACEAFEALTGEWPDQAGLVFQSDKPPYSTILRAIDREDLEIASFRNRRARRRFRECLDSGHWPGPGEDIASYRRPQWQHEMLIEEMNNEGLTA